MIVSDQVAKSSTVSHHSTLHLEVLTVLKPQGLDPQNSRLSAGRAVFFGDLRRAGLRSPEPRSVAATGASAVET